MDAEPAFIEGNGLSFRFGPEEHLKGRGEIRAVFSRGRRVGCRPFAGCGGAKLFLLKNALPHNRICFTFSRGFGNAVRRNRARRLCREVYRHLRHRLLRGYDLILLMYPEEPAPGVKNSGVAPDGKPQSGFTAQRGLVAKTEQLSCLFLKAGLLQ